MPLPTSSTSSSRSGASARPSARWRSGSSPSISESWTTGTSASGNASFSGTNVPWSKPRAGSAAVGNPAPSSSARTRAASCGSPGAGHAIPYIFGGKPE